MPRDLFLSATLKYFNHKSMYKFHLFYSVCVIFAEVLRGLIDLQKVVVFCDESEISGVHDFIENACMNCLVVQPCTDARTLDGNLLVNNL